MARLLHIADQRGDEYVVDSWDGTGEDDWEFRLTAPVEQFRLSTGVGDVLEVVEGSIHDPGDATTESADGETAAELRETFAGIRSRLAEYADQYDVDLSERPTELSDGDVLLAYHPTNVKPNSFESEVFATLEGFWCEGFYYRLGYQYLASHPEEAIGRAMAFDLLPIADDSIVGFRYDAGTTERLREEPVHGRLSIGTLKLFELMDGVDGPEDFERPFYYRLDLFEEGTHIGELYDSADPPPGKRLDGHRFIERADCYEPHKVRASWIGAHALPVETVEFDERGAPIVSISPDAEPLDPGEM